MSTAVHDVVDECPFLVVAESYRGRLRVDSFPKRVDVVEKVSLGLPASDCCFASVGERKVYAPPATTGHLPIFAPEELGIIGEGLL